MTFLDDLDTPALLLDRAVLEANTARMRERMDRLGVSLRPHMKTAKSDQVARLASGSPGGPITVSTLREAEYFLDRGFTDIVYAVGITPSRLDTVAGLAARGADLNILTDDPSVAGAIARRASAAPVSFKVLDRGRHRWRSWRRTPRRRPIVGRRACSGRGRKRGAERSADPRRPLLPRAQRHGSARRRPRGARRRGASRHSPARCRPRLPRGQRRVDPHRRAR